MFGSTECLGRPRPGAEALDHETFLSLGALEASIDLPQALVKLEEPDK